MLIVELLINIPVSGPNVFTTNPPLLLQKNQAGTTSGIMGNKDKKKVKKVIIYFSNLISPYNLFHGRYSKIQGFQWNECLDMSTAWTWKKISKCGQEVRRWEMEQPGVRSTKVASWDSLWALSWLCCENKQCHHSHCPLPSARGHHWHWSPPAFTRCISTCHLLWQLQLIQYT